ncbi:hypothetical protein [Bacillus suaedae]|uniref:DUF4871 domain-containing protein n=1 Tax=Halalkalibacter suaedae TaxID=2822140 RepID=A0A940WZR9_9BACI|nr:hypothetical protein [Bacillus suaedae]MBP3951801.1 hypothetical protein [Bacillus suaedae]
MNMKRKILVFLTVLILVLTTACSPNYIKDSNTESKETSYDFFSPMYEDGEGRTFIGKKEKLSILLSEEFKKNTTNKYMWLIWSNDDDILNKRLSVVAFHQETGLQEAVLIVGENKTIQIPNKLFGPNHGADAHIPTNMEFSESGKWIMHVFLDDELHETLIVDVKD